MNEHDYEIHIDRRILDRLDWIGYTEQDDWDEVEETEELDEGLEIA